MPLCARHCAIARAIYRLSYFWANACSLPASGRKPTSFTKGWPLDIPIGPRFITGLDV